MHYPTIYTTESAVQEILNINAGKFLNVARKVFIFQRHHNAVYRQWVEALAPDVAETESLTAIPFIPISLFKTHQVIAADKNPEIVFTSSGTTGSQTSRHLVHSLELYRTSFVESFRRFYGDPADWAIIGLLPSYLERQGSSLVFMVEELVEMSKNSDSGLYLYDFPALSGVLERRESEGKKTWLIGVTYALVDFALAYPAQLSHTVIVETGGMKGRKKELTRMEVHDLLKPAFGLNFIHSEYGMTELLSQAYSSGEGIYQCPPWMKVLVREEDDPQILKLQGTGAICIIDLANVFSCSFIATEDLGRVYEDGSFEILGRMDNRDTRGCSLLTI